MAFGNVKQFMLTLADEPDFPETDAEAAAEFVKNCLKAANEVEGALYTDPVTNKEERWVAQPLRGAAIKATTRRKWTKGSDTKPPIILVLPVWETLPNTPEDIEVNKKLLAGIPVAA